MRITIDGVRHHKCDWCRNDFTLTGEDHLTLEVGKRSGIASQRTRLPGWRMRTLFVPQQLHFCIEANTGKSPCLAQWLPIVTNRRPKEYVR